MKLLIAISALVLATIARESTLDQLVQLSKINKKKKINAIKRKAKKAIKKAKKKATVTQKRVGKKAKKAIRKAKKIRRVRVNAKARALVRRAAQKLKRAKRKAARIQRRIDIDKRRKRIHEAGFVASLTNEKNHAEWLRGESHHITLNARIRARRAHAVRRMFRMRKNARRLTHLVKTIHQARLNKAIKSHKAAIRFVHRRVQELKAAKGRHLAARRAVYRARVNLAKGHRIRRSIIRTWNHRIRARRTYHSRAVKALLKAKAQRTKAKMIVIAAKASLKIALKSRQRAMRRERKERINLARLQKLARVQRARANHWNIVLKKTSRHYADKQLLQIRSGGCAKGNCKPYNSAGSVKQFGKQKH